MRTEFKQEKTYPPEPVIQLDHVGVRYRVPQERIPSFKEYVIRRLKGEISYQKFWALEDITLEISSGEVFGIIGPNGAGKSTLLKVVARVLHPTRGRVRVKGRVAPLLELGAGFDPELTGRENVYLNGAILGFSKANIDARFDRIVEFAGLQEFIDAPLRTYSSGMIARLGFSVATDVRPEILIVDEILSIGDVEFQARSFERIQSFQAGGTTILLVSHILDKVSEMCSRAIRLEHGRVVSAGSAQTVVNQYLKQTQEKEAQRLSDETESIKTDENNRWGTRKIEIVEVKITDREGRVQSTFHTNQEVQLHVDYIARERVPSPIFGVAVHRQDGLHISGPNTKFADMILPALEGKGHLTYTIPELPLLEGLYFFSVAATNLEDTEIYDYHDRLYPFRVANQGTGVNEKYGAVTLHGKWDLSEEDRQLH